MKQLFSSRHYTDSHSGREKLIHFACQLEALGSGISRIQKQFQNPKSLRILEPFRIRDISLPSASNWHAKWNNIFVQALHRSSQQSEEVDSLCELVWGTWKWSIANPKTVPESCGCNCFWIRDIPPPSASNWHAKWINFFWPGSVRICVWEKGAGLVRSILTCSHP